MNQDDIIAENKKEIKENALNFLQRRTAQMYWVAEDLDNPIVASSGCIVTFEDRRYVMTVLHGASEEIGLLGRDVTTNEIELRKIGRFPVVANTKMPIGSDRGDPVVDFTFYPLADTFVPVRKWELDDYSQEGCFDIVQPAYLPILELNKEDEYFCGGGLPISDDVLDRFQFKGVKGLRFDRCEFDYLYFNVQESLQGELSDLAGMSGAPIFDGNGIPVGLLCGGYNGQLWGICINRAIKILGDVLCQRMPTLAEVSCNLKERVKESVKTSYFSSTAASFL